MYFLKFAITGLESIEQDMKAEEKAIERAIPTALQYVGSEMIVNLRKHIFEDWYKPYKPKQYKRRTDDPSLGKGLRSLDYMDVQVKKDSLQFTYEPSGEHAVKEWHNRDGDDLITFLQLGGEGMPARPFWNNFVGEQRDEGIMQAFIKGMKPYTVIPEGVGIDVVFDGNEGELEAGDNTQLSFDQSEDDEELPY